MASYIPRTQAWAQRVAAKERPNTDQLMTMRTLDPERSEQQMVNRIVLQKMLQQALQVNNPDRKWFGDVIKDQLAVLAKIARMQQELGIDIPSEVRAILDPKALSRKGNTCMKVSKGGKGKPPKGLVDASCVRDGQWVYTNEDGVERVYQVEKSGGKRVWREVKGLSSALKAAYKAEHVARGG